VGLLQITGFTENPRGMKLRYKLVQGGETGSVSGLVSAPAAKSSPHSWDARLLALNPRGWREAFALGQEIAAQPPEDGWLALERNWSAITNKDARQQLLKAFKFANHPHVIDVVGLALADPVPEVQNWGLLYLKDVALRDFSDDFAAARTWVVQQRGHPLAQVASDSAHAAVKRLNDGDTRVVLEQLDLLQQPDVLRKYPEAVAASGLDQALERLVNSGNKTVSEAALKAAAGPPLGEAWYRRVAPPFLRPEHSVKARSAAASLLQQRGGDWAVEPLLNALTNLLTASTTERRSLFGQFAGALGGIGSPKVIPILIGVIEAEDTYDTVYGIGYFGLGKLTGVSYDEKHDGAWWRQWWEKNKQRFPADVQATEIPRFKPVRPARL
jgi:hypothetical protein